MTNQKSISKASTVASNDAIPVNKAGALEWIGRDDVVSDCLQHLSSELRGDVDVVRAALEKHPGNLRFAQLNCRNNLELVLLALKKNYAVVNFIGEGLLADKQAMLKIIELGKGQFPDGFRYASEELKADKEVAKSAFSNHIHSAQYMAPSLRGRKFYLELWEVNPTFDAVRIFRNLSEIDFEKSLLAFQEERRKLNPNAADSAYIPKEEGVLAYIQMEKSKILHRDLKKSIQKSRLKNAKDAERELNTLGEVDGAVLETPPPALSHAVIAKVKRSSRI